MLVAGDTAADGPPAGCATMSRYPDAIWAPWKYLSPGGDAAYYFGQNRPVAVVLHVMQGWMTTVLSWTRLGYPHASWHFSVARDGRVYQHLDFADGGYHAGITDAQAASRPPLWRLWRGRGVNVNHYTIGVEHEGFAGEPFTPAQAAASRDLCRWLAAELGIPLDRDHFPPHAAIDTVNRVNDFNTPALREEHYQYLFEEDEMTPQEKAEFSALQSEVADLRAVVALITRAPATALIPGTDDPWNMFVRFDRIEVELYGHEARNSAGAHGGGG